MIERFDRVEGKVHRLEPLRRLLEESSSTMRIKMDRIVSRLGQQIPKAGKINTLRYRDIVNKFSL